MMSDSTQNSDSNMKKYHKRMVEIRALLETHRDNNHPPITIKNFATCQTCSAMHDLIKYVEWWQSEFERIDRKEYWEAKLRLADNR